MSTRRAIRSTRTNRCGAPATRRSPASAVRTAEAPSAYHTAPTAARTGRPSAHCAFPAGKRRPMGRDKVCSRKTVPELRDIKHRAAGASKRRSVGRRAVGTPGLLWKMQRSGSQGNLFAFLGNMSYFCRVSADRPPPPTDNPLRYASAPARSHPNPIVQPNENDTSAVRLPAGTRPEESAHGQKRPPHSFRLAVKRMPRFRAETATQ